MLLTWPDLIRIEAAVLIEPNEALARFRTRGVKRLRER